MVGFGIDLAGYTTGKTSLAFVDIRGRSASATILRGSALSKKRRTDDSLNEIVKDEVAVLRQCLAIGPVAVDVPIDLQTLPHPKDPQTVWALTKRPIDYAINAMPPFADRIGSPVARFAEIMRRGKFFGLLGTQIFEAYPSITLRMLNIDRRYKGKIGASKLVSLCKNLRIHPNVENDDDLDAIICAITAAAPSSGVHEAAAFKVEAEKMPTGFRIPKNLTFEKIKVATEDFAKWMQTYKVSV
jgi:hypothetical protein